MLGGFLGLICAGAYVLGKNIKDSVEIDQMNQKRARDRKYRKVFNELYENERQKLYEMTNPELECEILKKMTEDDEFRDEMHLEMAEIMGAEVEGRINRTYAFRDNAARLVLAKSGYLYIKDIERGISASPVIIGLEGENEIGYDKFNRYIENMLKTTKPKLQLGFLSDFNLSSLPSGETITTYDILVNEGCGRSFHGKYIWATRSVIGMMIEADKQSR